jgi:hypothetical protein
MPTDVSAAGRHKRLHDELIALRAAAITKLEQRGYEVRGKTPAQIRHELKRRRSKPAAQLSPPLGKDRPRLGSLP